MLKVETLISICKIKVYSIHYHSCVKGFSLSILKVETDVYGSLILQSLRTRYFSSMDMIVGVSTTLIVHTIVVHELCHVSVCHSRVNCFDNKAVLYRGKENTKSRQSRLGRTYTNYKEGITWLNKYPRNSDGKKDDVGRDTAPLRPGGR